MGQQPKNNTDVEDHSGLVGGRGWSEKIQNYSDVIYGWPLWHLVELLSYGNGGNRIRLEAQIREQMSGPEIS